MCEVVCLYKVSQYFLKGLHNPGRGMHMIKQIYVHITYQVPTGMVHTHMNDSELTVKTVPAEFQYSTSEVSPLFQLDL